MVEQAIDDLLHPLSLYSAADFFSRPCPFPASPGVYAWYFDEVLPGVPIEGCHQALGHTLLYVGIAPKEAKGQAVKPSIRTLRHRMRDHFTGNAEGSTLRLTWVLAVGCPEHRVAPCGQRKTLHLHKSWRDHSGHMDGPARSVCVGRGRKAVASGEDVAVHGAPAAEAPGQYAPVRIHPEKHPQGCEGGGSDAAGGAGQRRAAQGSI
jgi:hypothetical protein